MGHASEHVKEDILVGFESRRREIQSIVSEHIEEYDSCEEYESDVKVTEYGELSEKVHKNCYDFVGALEAADNQGDDMNLQFTMDMEAYSLGGNRDDLLNQAVIGLFLIVTVTTIILIFDLNEKRRFGPTYARSTSDMINSSSFPGSSKRHGDVNLSAVGPGWETNCVHPQAVKEED
ncbi:hypothetical protein OPV22_017883 [Ensete ventricosum]|uniref:Uncharacterized protein n=1 Tax=Ensete ventricosum TaxID=4639 RepID=A0AAV8QY89_ENSVE|nr:hypothetical protein OPV22_017883 [Ensete ventricosum]